jgi:iron complex outermembrane recepter protein
MRISFPLFHAVVGLCACWLFLFSPAYGQSIRDAVRWLSQLQDIQTRLGAVPPPEEGQLSDIAEELQTIRNEARRYFAESRVAAPQAAQAATTADLTADADALRVLLEKLQREREGGVFQMGRVEVNVQADLPQLVTVETLDESDFRQRNLAQMPDALEMVPGVSLQRIGPRNERGVFVRGFDVRQVPLYIDGIPVYVPYDGYVDMDRFLTFDVSEVQISKGFNSPLYGPNAIGGAINLITKAPSKPLHLDLGTGYASGRQFNSFANAGARFGDYWLQGSFAWLSSDTFPLSGNFTPVPLQPAGDRLNADQRDYKTRVRVGWNPNARDEYSFTYANQKGQKGNPVYAGNDPLVRPRFWQWPQWDKESFYFVGNKSLGEATYLRTRLYYDKFDNLLKSFDNATFTTQTMPFAFTSPFDDDTYGTTMEFGTRAGERQTIKSSFYFKDDTHREGNIGTPTRSFRDQTFSVGFENTIRINDRASAIVGFSMDHLKVMNAEQFIRIQVLPVERNNVWAYNPQAGIFYTFAQATKVRFTFARKTRLPTIKDRYSFRFGLAIPNPQLREERSDNWETGISHLLGSRTVLDVNLFRSNVSNSTQQFFLQPNLFQLQNIGTARFMGGETSIRSSITNRLELQANYTYLSRRNMRDPSLIMFDTPRHKTYSSATYRLTDRITLLADLRYEGGRWFQNESGLTGRAPSFALFGFGGWIHMFSGVEVQGGMNNMLDRNFFLVEGYPEQGRNVYTNLRYRF